MNILQSLLAFTGFNPALSNGCYFDCPRPKEIRQGFDVFYYQHELGNTDFYNKQDADLDSYLMEYIDAGPLEKTSGVTDINFSPMGPEERKYEKGFVYGKPFSVSNFSLEFKGYYKAPVDGVYTLECEADDFMSLQVGRGHLCCGEFKDSFNDFRIKVNTEQQPNFYYFDGHFTMVNNASCDIVMKAGLYYPIRLVYFNAVETADIKTVMIQPDGKKVTQWGSDVFQLDTEEDCSKVIERSQCASDTTRFSTVTSGLGIAESQFIVETSESSTKLRSSSVSTSSLKSDALYQSLSSSAMRKFNHLTDKVESHGYNSESRDASSHHTTISSSALSTRSTARLGYLSTPKTEFSHHSGISYSKVMRFTAHSSSRETISPLSSLTQSSRNTTFREKYFENHDIRASKITIFDEISIPTATFFNKGNVRIERSLSLETRSSNSSGIAFFHSRNSSFHSISRVTAFASSSRSFQDTSTSVSRSEDPLNTYATVNMSIKNTTTMTVLSSKGRVPIRHFLGSDTGLSNPPDATSSEYKNSSVYGNSRETLPTSPSFIKDKRFFFHRKIFFKGHNITGSTSHKMNLTKTSEVSPEVAASSHQKSKVTVVNENNLTSIISRLLPIPLNKESLSAGASKYLPAEKDEVRNLRTAIEKRVQSYQKTVVSKNLLSLSTISICTATANLSEGTSTVHQRTTMPNLISTAVNRSVALKDSNITSQKDHALSIASLSAMTEEYTRSTSESIVLYSYEKTPIFSVDRAFISKETCPVYAYATFDTGIRTKQVPGAFDTVLKPSYTKDKFSGPTRIPEGKPFSDTAGSTQTAIHSSESQAIKKKPSSSGLSQAEFNSKLSWSAVQTSPVSSDKTVDISNEAKTMTAKIFRYYILVSVAILIF